MSTLRAAELRRDAEMSDNYTEWKRLHREADGIDPPVPLKPWGNQFPKRPTGGYQAQSVGDAVNRLSVMFGGTS